MRDDTKNGCVADYSDGSSMIYTHYLIALHPCTASQRWPFPSNSDTVDLLGLDPFDQWFFSSGAGDDQRFGQVAITGIFCADGLK